LSVSSFVVKITVFFFVVNQLVKAFIAWLNQIVKHVDAYEIRHIGVHYFALKKLESKVAFLRA